MTEYYGLIFKLVVLAMLGVVIVGLVTICLRRVAVWALVGQAIALKGVVAGAFLLSLFPLAGRGELVVISLITLGLVPGAALTGLLVLHRCARFGGTLDVDEETNLRN